MNCVVVMGEWMLCEWLDGCVVEILCGLLM